jgi:KipI family sensor histidine kinase inhibitor
VEFAPVIAPEVNRRVRALLAALDADPLPGVLDLVPAYRSLLIGYDPVALSHAALLERLRALEPALDLAAPASRVVTVPVAYGGDFGPDLADVAAHTGLSSEEVIARHAAGRYIVYFLGFAPGFPYLGGLDPALATPRLPQPRTSVPAGAVGIGGAQTGVYTLSTPGGWRIIGRTPVRPYDSAATEPFLLRAGDELRFRPIDAAEFAHLEGEIMAGRYRPEIVTGEGEG